MVPFVALARWRARCLGSIGEGQTQGLVVVAHAGEARERLARRASCAAGAAIFDNFTRKISFGFLIRINSIISSENFQKKNFTRDPNSDFGVIISFWISSEILQN